VSLINVCMNILLDKEAKILHDLQFSLCTYSAFALTRWGRWGQEVYIENICRGGKHMDADWGGSEKQALIQCK
jgi:hypothetical protein